MPTQKGGYRTANGDKVPSVTTIIGRFKESGGLIHWSWNIAHEGLELHRHALKQVCYNQDGGMELAEQLLNTDEDNWHYRKKRDDAANAGTIAHDLVERWIKGDKKLADATPAMIAKDQECDIELAEMARKAMDAFLEWADQSKLTTAATEIPMVSETYRFGGTPDAILVNGKLSMGDWKTSNAIYPDYLLQLAAYKELWEENRPDEPIVGGFHLLRFDKEFGDFHHHFWSELDDAWAAFMAERDLYDLMKKLEKRVK